MTAKSEEALLKTETRRQSVKAGTGSRIQAGWWFFQAGKIFSVLAGIGLLIWLHCRLSVVESDLNALLIRSQGLNNWEGQLPKDWDVKEEMVEGFGSEPVDGELKRIKRRVDHHTGKSKTSAKPGSESHHVEFLNPRPREDVDGVKGSGPIGPETDGQWVTAYSRIPVSAMQEFCSDMKNNCPPGAQGPLGKQGPKGDRGDVGFMGEPGPRGHVGNPGLPGLRGPRGEMGISGLSGTDGRDGLPGEPGLDGIPGRNGVDGIPGQEGLRGMHGTNGKDGKNGTDGIPGQKGEIGPSGNVGGRGLQGIAGQKGTAGTPGLDGTPGVQAWIFKNGTEKGILIPPAIIGSKEKTRALVVKEEDNVRLRCTATGSPPPTVVWRRADGDPIRLGTWNVESVEGSLLNLTRINRAHMGEYICMVGNGLTPSAQRSHHIQVHFPPLIVIQNQHAVTLLNTTAVLNCHVEAFPAAVYYWESSHEKLLTNGDKYNISYVMTSPYQATMTLSINRVSRSDLTFYYCACKNILGLVKGRLNLSEMDPNQATPPPHGVVPHGTGVTYGKQAPKFEDYTDNCPPAPPPCKECPARIEPSKCTVGGYYLLDKFLWDIHPLGTSGIKYSPPTAADRPPSRECVLSAVGKAVFHGKRSFEGTWMRETYEGNVAGAEKYWMTRMGPDYSMTLLEFYNKTEFIAAKTSKTIRLDPGFKGNYHTIYNGSFYYVAQPVIPESGERLRVFRQSLTVQGNMGYLELPHSSFSDNATSLYSTGARVERSWADLAVDENGLWAIYSIEHSNNTAVVKIEVDENERMNITFGWNITISHKHAGDMFIICGVLYAVDSVVEHNTKIRMALDLYKHQLLKVELPFTNPFLQTIMISYNPKTRELFTWDGGNQLIYPVKHAATGVAEFGPNRHNPQSNQPAQPERYGGTYGGRRSRETRESPLNPI